MSPELFIRGAKRFDTGDIVDLSIRNGVIEAIGQLTPPQDIEVIEVAGLLVSPGFVDAHVHLDKTRSLGDVESPTLAEAIKNYSEFYQAIPSHEIKENIKTRAKATVREAVKAGTTTMRSQVNIEGDEDLLSLEAVDELRRELADYIDIKISCLPNLHGDDALIEKRLAAVQRGLEAELIDFVGGSPHMVKRRPDITEKLFEIAVCYDKPLDFHIDEHDEADITTFLQTIELTLKHGYEGRVTCGHVTALAAVSDEDAAKAIAGAKQANLHIITLPSCNLYLMGRTDRQPIRRGVTRIREFLDAGVNIAYASDNILDPFRPIGNGDMLEEGLLCAQVAQMVTRSELAQIYAMGTINASKTLQLQSYGLNVGSAADIVLMEADNVADALIRRATRRFVIKRGVVVATSSYSSDVVF